MTTLHLHIKYFTYQLHQNTQINLHESSFILFFFPLPKEKREKKHMPFFYFYYLEIQVLIFVIFFLLSSLFNLHEVDINFMNHHLFYSFFFFQKRKERSPFIIFTFIYNTGSYFCYFIFYYRHSSIFMKSKSTS